MRAEAAVDVAKVQKVDAVATQQSHSHSNAAGAVDTCTRLQPRAVRRRQMARTDATDRSAADADQTERSLLMAEQRRYPRPSRGTSEATIPQERATELAVWREAEDAVGR